MANHKSAEKRNRQRLVRTTRGRSVRTRVRRVLKQARIACDNGDDNAAALVKQATSLLDRAATKNAMPIKRTARLKGRLAKRLNKALAGDKTEAAS